MTAVAPLEWGHPPLGLPQQGAGAEAQDPHQVSPALTWVDQWEEGEGVREGAGPGVGAGVGAHHLGEALDRCFFTSVLYVFWLLQLTVLRWCMLQYSLLTELDSGALQTNQEAIINAYLTAAVQQ